MNISLPALLLLCLSMLVSAQDKADPFAAPEPKLIDRSSDKKSDKFLSDKLLEALDERRLDEGMGTGSAVIRITILRSFHAPLVLKWFPAEPNKESWLHVKRLKWEVNDKGERNYLGLDLNKKIKLRPSQEKLLKTIYAHSSLQELPQAYWTPEALDGSQWIYEAAAKDGSILIARRNPINPTLNGTKIQTQRLLHELQLTTFALMLWTLSEIDEEPY